MLRVLHFSDVHVQAPLRHLKPRDWASKRAVGAMNLLARRGRYFADALTKLEALDRFRRQQAADLVLCTGDYTALGTEEEHRLAREAIQPLTEAPLGFVTVPGNHDVYLPDALTSDRFARHFGDLVTTDAPESAVDGVWPTLRLVGDDLAVVAVNTARPNRNPVRSSGAIPDSQLGALSRLLDDSRLAGRWVFVMTHYALLKRDGSPDSAHHGIDNASKLSEVCARRPRVSLLHGHIHWRYSHAPTPSSPRSFGAGSATHAGREGFWLYEIEANSCVALPGSFRNGDYEVDRDAAVSWSTP
jgi:3',5'-cyclic AMP phosphodiesterase CpdA